MALSFFSDLRSFNLEELRSYLQSLGYPPFRADQIMGWLHKKHAVAYQEMNNLPKALIQNLSKNLRPSSLELAEVVPSQDQESFKYLFRTNDCEYVETVLIVQQERFTVCVSTQLGCRMKCSFCASGKGRFGRNLTAGEIVEQISVINRGLSAGQEFRRQTGKNLQRSEVTNIVFMGMGEPLDNYEATVRAIEILMADWGFGLGGRRITVSTSGLIPAMERFVREMKGRVRLSVSLHSSNDVRRSELVPINKKYHLKDLIESLEQLHRDLKREITFEYTLIKNINDSREEAMGVARIANRLNAKVNLIPYNPIREMEYERPDADEVEQFRDWLQQKKVRVTVRQTVGRDIDAACGQLRLMRH